MANCEAYINKTIPLIGIKAQSMEHHPLADRARTLGGSMRQDSPDVAPKRSWRIETTLLTNAEYDAVMAHLDAIHYAATWWWIDELGGAAATDSIYAYITVEGDERVQFRSSSGWESQGRVLTLLIEEQ